MLQDQTSDEHSRDQWSSGSFYGEVLILHSGDTTYIIMLNTEATYVQFESAIV